MDSLTFYNNDLRSIFPVAINFDKTFKSVNHRGYSNVAPENTLAAFRLSKFQGFNYVETDISFTADGIPVLSHDATIDRCSNGSGTVSEMSYEDIRAYDFGSWKNSIYEGERIPNFKEFLKCCKMLGLHPYIEIKSNATYTKDQLKMLVQNVKEYGMQGKVTWISFNIDYLNTIGNTDNTARIGYLQAPTETRVGYLLSLRNKGCDVFFDSNYTVCDDEKIQLCIDNDIPLEVWTLDEVNDLMSLDPYISGITTNCLIAGKEFYNKYI